MNKLTYSYDESKYEVSAISNDTIQRITFREKETNQDYFTLIYKPDIFSILAYRKDIPVSVNGENFIIHYDHVFEAYLSEFPLEAIECEGIKINI
jgi:hypothetical protein